MRLLPILLCSFAWPACFLWAPEFVTLVPCSYHSVLCWGKGSFPSLTFPYLHPKDRDGPDAEKDSLPLRLPHRVLTFSFPLYPLLTLVFLQMYPSLPRLNSRRNIWSSPFSRLYLVSLFPPACGFSAAAVSPTPSCTSSRVWFPPCWHHILCGPCWSSRVLVFCHLFGI